MTGTVRTIMLLMVDFLVSLQVRMINGYTRGLLFVNPRRACAARVTVVVRVRLSVCPLVGNSLIKRLFVLKTLSHTQRATKVKKFVGFSMKPIRF